MIEVINRILKLDLTENESLRSSKLTSLLFVQLIVALEDLSGKEISLDDLEYEKYETIQDICNMLGEYFDEKSIKESFF